MSRLAVSWKEIREEPYSLTVMFTVDRLVIMHQEKDTRGGREQKSQKIKMFRVILNVVSVSLCTISFLSATSEISTTNMFIRVLKNTTKSEFNIWYLINLFH